MGGDLMNKKKIILVIICIAACVTYLYPTEQPYKYRQVKRLAIAEDNYLLPVLPHISQVEQH